MRIQLLFISFSFLFVATALETDFLTATVADLLALLESGEVTSEQLVKSYVSRIEENNYKGLQLRAVLETAPYEKLIEQARYLDEKRKNGRIVGPLHGIPFLVKDNIATDISLGMNTTAGSYALVGAIVPRDATVIAKLRKAGAIILGKSNLSEFAQFKAYGLTFGWSARGGQTQCAYVYGGFAAGGNPGGSSSGSGVGVSAGFAPAALGTETEGSIIGPSNRAALYGIKPTVGLVSRAGVIPITTNQDTVGPMAKSTYDAALILSVIAGRDPLDNKTWDIPPSTPEDYTQFTKDATFKGFRLGVPRNVFFTLDYIKSQQIIDEANAAIDRIASLGAVIHDPADLPSAEEILTSNAEVTVTLTDFKVQINGYFEALNTSKVRSLEDLINFNDANSDLEFKPQCCQQILVASVQTTGRDNDVYREALAENIRLGATEGIDAALNCSLASCSLDALILPSEGIAVVPPGLAGYPIVTAPLGILNTTGRPFGLSFFGTKYSEPTLIRLMAAFEKHFPPRALPLPLLDSSQRNSEVLAESLVNQADSYH